MPIDRVFRDWILVGTDRVCDTSSRERVVRPTGEKEKDAKLDDTELNDLLAECQAIRGGLVGLILMDRPFLLGGHLQKCREVGDRTLIRFVWTIVPHRCVVVSAAVA